MLDFVQISNRAIGNIKLDATTEESHQSELSITENPIESGASIADHSVLQPKQITIVGVMVDHDQQGLGLSELGLPHIRGATDFLNQLPLPVPFAMQTAQTLSKATRLLSQGLGMAAQAQQVFGQVRALAPFLPDFGLGNLLDSSPNSSRVKKCYADLIACQKSGETIDIQTGLHLYQNMLLQSVSVKQTADGSAEFTLTAREIFIVETKSIKGANSVMGNKKSGRASVQSASKVNQGITQPKAAEKIKSWLNNLWS